MHGFYFPPEVQLGLETIGVSESVVFSVHLLNSTDTWGFGDVQAAVAAIPSWINIMSWTGPLARLDALYVTGHSNGGQGAWYALTHLPDNIKGAAPVSGYSSIQAYVPYTFWHEADPGIASIIQKSLSNYRHELLIDNAKGIPIQQQHGDMDDNVPPFHSRRMYQLLTQTESSPSYNELSGKGHWYDGVMVTPKLQRFYEKISNGDADISRLPRVFSIVIPCSGTMGSRGGIFVEQLVSPDQQGRIDVQRNDSDSWMVTTSNIRRFRFSLRGCRDNPCNSMVVDGCKISLKASPNGHQRWFDKDSDGFWTVGYALSNTRRNTDSM